MLSQETLQAISHYFGGDTEGYFTYKTGTNLVSFFNSHFNRSDKYGQGFPSRWVYVYDRLVELLNACRFDDFLNIVLSNQYLVSEQNISQVEAAELASKIYSEFSRLVQRDVCLITNNNGKYHLCKENSDLVKIGNGGYANVYSQKSTGLVLKKLKDDFLTDKGIRSRFKREYTITKSLQDSYGIISVYVFNENNCSYTMELAEKTLYDYVIDSNLNCTLICGRFKRFKGLILSRQVVLFLKDKLLLLCIQNIHLVKALPTPIDTFHCCNNQSIY